MVGHKAIFHDEVGGRVRQKVTLHNEGERGQAKSDFVLHSGFLPNLDPFDSKHRVFFFFN